MEKPHRRLDVWLMSMDFVADIYRTTSEFPSDEKFGLTSQMRRCAVSIPSNIAEGAARGSSVDYARFLTIAIGSVAELDTQLELATRLDYISAPTYEKLDTTLTSISRMLIALRRSMQSKH